VMAEWLLDGVLVATLLATALAVVVSTDLFRAVVLFIAFGLLMALCWVRLGAPDVALAEAAIGAGLTGVLLLDAVGHLGGAATVAAAPHRERIVGIALTACLLAVVATALLQVVTGAPAPIVVADLIEASLPDSGVSNPVTAVLLNFRSYDTLLEIAVLVAAGIVGIAAARVGALEPRARRVDDVLLHALERWLVPLALMLAVYLLWAGADRTGGAFQAAAVLAATGVLLRLSGVPMAFLRPGATLRVGMIGGFAVFLLVAVLGALTGAPFLAYPEGWAGLLILVVEVVLTVSIALVMLALFAAPPAPPVKRDARK